MSATKSAIDLALTDNDLVVFAGFSLLVVVLLIHARVRQLLKGKRTPRLAGLSFQTFFGIVACLLYERMGSLLPGIVLHVFIDSGAFSFAVSGTVRLVLVIAIITAVGLLLSPVVRVCRRFVNHEPVLREF
jgi:hypothetical protein